MSRHPGSISGHFQSAQTRVPGAPSSASGIVIRDPDRGSLTGWAVLLPLPGSPPSQERRKTTGGHHGGVALLVAGFLVVLSACGGAPVLDASPSVVQDSTRAVTEVARFRDARAVAADPSGRLYVVDAAESAVILLAPDGRARTVLGGPGSGDYSFIDPSDIDPANGLDFFVADAGNARIQRLSTDGRFIETVPVPVGDPEGVRPNRTVDPSDPAQRGRPIGVAVGPAGSLYAIEAERNVVLRWDTGRRLSNRLGADGPGRLGEPVGLAVTSEGTVFVADAAQDAVLVYDELGTFVRAIPGAAAGGVRAVALAPSQDGLRLLIVGPHAVAVHRVVGGLVEVVPVSTSEPLVGAAVSRGVLFALTRTRLLRVE